ncbi:MAG: hypothetical protein V4525_03860 [Pseudomonadota bacterium]
MKMTRKEFAEWQTIRSKGCIHYVVKESLISWLLCISINFVINKIFTMGYTAHNIVIFSIGWLVASIIIRAIRWYSKERAYEKELKIKGT